MTATQHEKRKTFVDARRHGATLQAAARKAKLTLDEAHRIEGRTYCASCGDHVRYDDCPHWDYES